MKDIAEHYGPQERQSMHRWFWRSVLMLSALCIGIALATVQQSIGYYYVRQEHAQLKSGTVDLHACLARKRELKERVERLDVRLSKLNRMRHQPKNPAVLLRVLDTLSSDVHADDIVLKKKKLDLVVHAPDTASILAYADRLKKQEFCPQVEVASVEQVAERIKAALQVVLR